MLRWLLRQWLRRAHRRAMDADASPRAAQEALHARMAIALRGTRAAELQDARAWEGLEAYRRHLRLTDYEDYRALVDEARSAPWAGAFERAATTDFGHSSSGGKHVPFTRAHIATFRAFQIDALAELAVGQGFDDVLGRSARSLMIQGSLDVQRSVAGVTSGYSSAVMVERTPWLLKRRLLPSLAVLRLPDPAERAARIGRALVDRQPRVLTGMPENVVGVLRQLLEGPDAARVRNALGRIRAYAWSGMSLGPYKAFLDEHLAPDVRYFDALSSTEGPMGLHAGGALGVYRPAFARSLLLFGAPDDPSDRRFAWELAPGETVAVLLGSFAGLHGYRVGDRVRVVSTRPVRFELLPRAVDVGEACAELEGASDFCAYVDPRTHVVRLLVEAVRPPSGEALRAFATRVGAASASVRLVAPGRIARAAAALSLQGIAKLPRVHSRAEVQDALERVA
jgi:hypothetical protein